jgi:uncharacterized protein (TIGR00106 family)
MCTLLPLPIIWPIQLQTNFPMNVMIDFCLIPLGTGVSVSPYIAECQRILKASGLSYSMHAYGTNVEGEWEAVMGVLKNCHEKIHAMGAPRIHTTLKLGTRTDKQQSLKDKIASVEEKLS